MRLIAGIVHLDGEQATEATLARMAAAMTPPGLRPSVARRLDGPAGLLMLDFSGRDAHLSERDGWIVAADLRLDRPRGAPEADLLEAVASHGRDFPDRLDGDFGVALWHGGRGELWLGRDFIGARPLAWTWQPGRWFAFASLPKGLHAAGLAEQTLDHVALARKVTQTFFSGADSGFAEVKYLEAGHSLRMRSTDTAPPRPHRAYRPSVSQVGRWRGTPEQAAAKLRILIDDAVAARMPRSGPVACHLTGGLDSSAITVLAARLARARGERVMALNLAMEVAFGPAEFDERPLIAEVLRQEADIAYRCVPDVLPLPGHDEEPDWPGSIVGGGEDQIMAAAAAFGADRLLSGVGGDEGATYNGANLYLALLRAGRWPTLLRELTARARTDLVSLARTAYRRLAAPALSEALRLGRRRGVMDNKQGAVRYLAPSMVERVIPGRLQPVLHSNRAVDRARAFSDHHIPSRCTYYSVMAARHGIAASFPLLDRRVVDFVLSLPVHLFLAEGYSRQPFRRAMRGVLPERVRLASAKVGLFDHRFVLLAQRRAELLASLAELRSRSLPVVTEMFDLDAIQAGLELIPNQDEVADRAAKGMRIIGRSPWVVTFALEALILARRIADKSSAV